MAQELIQKQMKPALSIVMSYYNRKKLLQNTLNSFLFHGYGNLNLEIIIVDDGSDEIQALNKEFLDLYRDQLRIKIITLNRANKWYRNPCIPYNIGFREAEGDKVLIQNPECLHLTNVVKHALNYISEHDYISYACYSLSKQRTENLLPPVDFAAITKLALLDENATDYGSDGWYNHSIIRPTGYHFAAAIDRNTLLSVGMFDERLARGIGFDDDALIHSFRMHGLKITVTEEALVAHQWHYSAPTKRKSEALRLRNKFIYHKVIIKNIAPDSILSSIFLIVAPIYPIVSYLLIRLKKNIRIILGADLYERLKKTINR